MFRNKQSLVYILILFFLIVIHLSCASKKTIPDTTKKEDEFLFEYEKEGFIDNNTFRVVVIIPAEEQYNELSAQQKGRERAFVSLKQYILSQNKQFDAKMHNALITTITEYGTLKKRDSMLTTRHCYYYDIVKSGLKEEIDAWGK